MSKRRRRREKAKLPVATVACYGPDNKTATKVVVDIVKEWGKGPVAEAVVGGRMWLATSAFSTKLPTLLLLTGPRGQLIHQSLDVSLAPISLVANSYAKLRLVWRHVIYRAIADVVTGYLDGIFLIVEHSHSSRGKPAKFLIGKKGSVSTPGLFIALPIEVSLE